MFAGLMSKKGLSLIALFVILTAIPLTVFLSQQRQEIRQRAEEIQAPTFNISGNCNTWSGNASLSSGGDVSLDFFLDGNKNPNLGIKQDPHSGNNVTYYLGGKTISGGGNFTVNVGSEILNHGSIYPDVDPRSPADLFSSGQPIVVSAYAHPPNDWAPNHVSGRVLNLGSCSISTPTPPTASLSGPNSGTVGKSLTYRADLGREAQEGEIWVTKGDGKSSFDCPAGIVLNSEKQYWCKLAARTTSPFEGSYTPSVAGQYWVVVNGYNRPLGLSCSGNPFGLPSGWSDCGPNDQISLNVAAAPTPTYLAADVDHNGCVGIFDFNLWVRAFQSGTVQSGTYPDINNDGRLDLLDFNAWYIAMRSLAGTDRLCQ